MYSREEYEVTLSDYGEAKMLYSDNPGVNPSDVVRNPFKTFFEIPVKVTINDYSIKKRDRELFQKAATNHKMLRLKGTLYVSPSGLTIERVRQNWKENGFWFWYDSVEEVPEVVKEVAEKKNGSN